MQNKEKVYRVLLVDNHPITLAGLRYELKKRILGIDFEIVAEARNGRQAIQVLKDRPEINLLILDVEMDEMDGLEVAEEIRTNERFEAVKIVIYTNYKSRLIAAKALAIGVDGFVLKDSPLNILVDAIMHSMNGMYFIDPGLGKTKPQKSPMITNEKQELSPWEKLVTCEILKQKKDAEIAEDLKSTVEIIENTKRKIKDKTGATNIVGIVLYAIEHNICKNF